MLPPRPCPAGRLNILGVILRKPLCWSPSLKRPPLPLLLPLPCLPAGRLNILGNVVRKPLAQIMREFSGKQFKSQEGEYTGSGDVKYHLGTSYLRPTHTGGGGRGGGGMHTGRGGGRR